MIIHSLVCLLFIATSVYAAVSEELLRNFYLYNQYSSASYCANVNDVLGKAGRRITCKTGTCPLVEKNNATVIKAMTEVLFSSIAVLAVDPTEKKLVLAFRGGQNVGLLWGGVQFLMGCPDVCPSCRCNFGPYSAWSMLRNQVVPEVRSAIKAYPGYPLVVTGYSIGASFAVFAASEFRNNNTDVTMYNYGQQRSGDATFANYITAQGKNYRITHTDDPIPRQQGDPAQGYRHTSPEYWVFKDNGPAYNYSVNATSIKQIIGINNNTGCGSGKGTNEIAHDRYFQEQMSLCLGNFSIGLTTIKREQLDLVEL